MHKRTRQTRSIRYILEEVCSFPLVCFDVIFALKNIAITQYSFITLTRSSTQINSRLLTKRYRKASSKLKQSSEAALNGASPNPSESVVPIKLDKFHDPYPWRGTYC